MVLGTKVLYAQFEASEFDFDRVKDVDSIVISMSSDSSFWKEVFYYSDGRRTRASYFDNIDFLTHYRLFHYSYNDQQSFESYHGKSSMFDSEKDDWIEFWDSTNFDLIIKKFSGPRLVQEMACKVNDSDTTVNQITKYTYDSKQRIISEVTQDFFNGIVGFYKSNSVELREIKEKTKVVLYSRTYIYEPGRIYISYKVNEKLTGKEILGLDGKGQVVSIKQYGDGYALLSETSALYDEKGRLKAKTWQTYSSMSIWGQETDVVASGTETTEYDNLGRPRTKLTVYTGGYKTNIEYRYY